MPAAPTSAGGLLPGPDQRRLRRALAGEPLRLVVGAADRVVLVEAIPGRQRHRCPGHFGNNAAAASPALPTSGSGSRMKNIVKTAASGAVDFVVIGTGVNLLSHPENAEYPATSLAENGIGIIPPALLLEGYVREFDAWLARWREEGFAPVREAWLARASGIGEDIRVRFERMTLTGRFVDLDEDGALLLDGAEGLRRIAAGDVFPALG